MHSVGAYVVLLVVAFYMIGQILAFQFSPYFLLFCGHFHVAISEDLHDVFTLREDTECDTYDMIRCS